MPRHSSYALDALSFFIADVQTGFGPFIAVYLATAGWSDGAIGQALSVGTLAAVASQLPGGAFVDRLRDKRTAVVLAGVGVGLAAVMFALSTSRASILGAEVLHSFSSAMLGPAVAAVSLAAVGRAALGERLGRNARFAAIGNGVAAAALGLAGSYLPPRAVFWLTAGFMLPGLATLLFVAPATPDGARAPSGGAAASARDGIALLTDRRVLLFALTVALFHLGNAALLPLAGSELTRRLGASTNLVVAGSVVVPQAIVALISPTVGRAADQHGLARVLALGFAAVPLRAGLLALVTDPVGIVAVQALDGLGAASFGVLVPLVAAELTRGTERFNLCLGVLGLATAAGATVSTGLGGLLAQRWGEEFAFLTLAVCGCAAVSAAWLFSPRGTEAGATGSS